MLFYYFSQVVVFKNSGRFCPFSGLVTPMLKTTNLRSSISTVTGFLSKLKLFEKSTLSCLLISVGLASAKKFGFFLAI